jgi:hypothetical protein
VAPIYPQKLVITSPTSGGRSVGIVRSRTQTSSFSYGFILKDKNFEIYRQNSVSERDSLSKFEFLTVTIMKFYLRGSFAALSSMSLPTFPNNLLFHLQDAGKDREQICAEYL